MSYVQSKQFSEFTFYITAQIERISLALQNQNKLADVIQQINANISKQQKKIDGFDNKIKLLEVYQSENFKNNQRIFNSQPIYQVINQKISLLEQMQDNLISNERGQKKEVNEDLVIIMERRLRETEIEIQKLKSKNVVLNKFRREISPTLPNCDSTKDISIDCSTKKQLKRLQTKIYDYLNQKLKSFEKKYFNSLNHSQSKDSTLMHVKNNCPAPKLKESDTYQINRDYKPDTNAQGHFRNKIDQYYNQTTQKQQISNKKRSQLKKIGKTNNKTNSKSKSKHRSKNKNSIQKAISLKSVSQYLKLANNTK